MGSPPFPERKPTRVTTIFPLEVFCNLGFMFSRGRELSLSSARFRILNIYAFSSSPAHFPHRFSARFSSFARSFDGLRNEPNGGSLLAPPSADSSRGTPLPRLRTCTDIRPSFSLAHSASSVRAAVKLSVCPTNQSEGVW